MCLLLLPYQRSIYVAGCHSGAHVRRIPPVLGVFALRVRHLARITAVARCRCAARGSAVWRRQCVGQMARPMEALTTTQFMISNSLCVS